jgi:hypothetical protein
MSSNMRAGLPLLALAVGLTVYVAAPRARPMRRKTTSSGT